MPSYFPPIFVTSPYLIVDWFWYSGKLTKLNYLQLYGAFEGTIPTEM
jgi:hypothetical protein